MAKHRISPERRSEICARNGLIGGLKVKRLGIGVPALTTEERRKNGEEVGHFGGEAMAASGELARVRQLPQTIEARSKSGTLWTHRRWHLDRRIFQPKCELCQEERRLHVAFA